MLLRKILRSYLLFLTKITLGKHSSTVFVVRGDEYVSMFRHMLFTALNSYYPARENHEKPEAEFSIPLAVLNYPHYPASAWEWLWVLLKSSLQIFTVPRFSHYLILEMHAVTTGIEELWLQALSPKYLINVDSQTRQNQEERREHVEGQVSLNVTTKKKPLQYLQKQAVNLATQEGVPEDIARALVDELQFPQTRIKFHATANGQVLVDARHYYYPMPLRSVLELLPEAETEGVIVISDLANDNQLISKAEESEFEIELNPPQITQTTKPIIVRGFKGDKAVLQQYGLDEILS